MSATAAAPVFRFDERNHEYTLNGQRIPSITQLVERGGLLGDGARFFTEASRDRGTEVHRLCADFDLGVLDIPTCASPQRGYLLAYVAACAALKPEWNAIEEAEVDTVHRFAGRIDRVGTVFGKPTVCEIKSGGKLNARPINYVADDGTVILLPQYTSAPHAVQCALGAMLWARRYNVAPEDMQRLIVYPKATGKFSVEQYTDRRDFDTARQLITRFC